MRALKAEKTELITFIMRTSAENFVNLRGLKFDQSNASFLRKVVVPFKTILSLFIILRGHAQRIDI